MSSGALLSTCPQIIEETVPFTMMDQGYGASTNIAISLMVVLIMFLGFAIPQDPEGLANS